MSFTNRGDLKKMKVITVMNNKGGEAKTTTALTLLAGLTDRGYKTLAIDLDSQANLTYTLKAHSSKTIQGVLTGELETKEAIQQVEKGSLIQSSPALAVIDNVLDSLEIYTGRTNLLKKALKSITNDFDFVIIDTPPALNTLTVNSLIASDFVVIPAQADIYSLQGLSKISDTVKKLTTARDDTPALNSKLKIAGILLTRYSDRSILSKDLYTIFNNKASEFNTKIFKSTIREAVVVREAHAQQIDIFSYAPKSNVAQDYNSFIDELLEEIK